MSKTFKLSAIFLITVVNLQICRILFSFLTLSDNISGWLFSFVFQVICMGLVPYLLYKFWIDKDDKAFARDCYIKAKIHPMTYVIAIVIGLMVFYLNTAISAIWYTFLRAVGYTYVSGVGTIYSSPEVLIFEIITTAMLPAIFEELTDRGLLLAVLNKRSDRAKILITGIMFGILHQNVAQLTPTMFGGLVMAYMVVKSGSIFPAMIVHFINNFLIVILNYSRQKGGYFNALYTAFVNFYSSNIILAFIFWGLAIALLYYSLKYLTSINSTKPIADKKQSDMNFINTIFSKAENTVDDFDMIFYGKKPEEQDIAVPKIEEVKEKSSVKWWEYGLLYCAIFTATLTTLFTYVWGLLR